MDQEKVSKGFLYLFIAASILAIIYAGLYTQEKKTTDKLIDIIAEKDKTIELLTEDVYKLSNQIREYVDAEESLQDSIWELDQRLASFQQSPTKYKNVIAQLQTKKKITEKKKKKTVEKKKASEKTLKKKIKTIGAKNTKKKGADKRKVYPKLAKSGIKYLANISEIEPLQKSNNKAKKINGWYQTAFKINIDKTATDFDNPIGKEFGIRITYSKRGMQRSTKPIVMTYKGANQLITYKHKQPELGNDYELVVTHSGNINSKSFAAIGVKDIRI